MRNKSTIDFCNLLNSPLNFSFYNLITLTLPLNQCVFAPGVERIESLRFLRSSEVTLGQGLLKKGEGREGYLSIYLSLYLSIQSEYLYSLYLNNYLFLARGRAMFRVCIAQKNLPINLSIYLLNCLSMFLKNGFIYIYWPGRPGQG